jgi:hypothetical protein
MRRARLVCILARFPRTFGRFDRVRVVPFFSRGPRGLLLLLDHDRDPNVLPPDSCEGFAERRIDYIQQG